MKDWERIRAGRDDLTDYVVHLTKRTLNPTYRTAQAVLLQILDDGFIKPTFAPLGNIYSSNRRPTVKGPEPTVCLTEQPLSAIIKTVHILSRYSGYGIAYHKHPLYQNGGRPVLYARETDLGRRLKKDEPGFVDGCDIFTNGLPAGYQYLFVNYEPGMPGSGSYPIDFTWEREWRIKPRDGLLPVLLQEDWWRTPKGAIIVEKDSDIPIVTQKLDDLVAAGREWAAALRRIVSLETADRMIQAGDPRYARLDTWPD